MGLHSRRTGGWGQQARRHDSGDGTYRHRLVLPGVKGREGSGREALQGAQGQRPGSKAEQRMEGSPGQEQWGSVGGRKLPGRGGVALGY